MPSILSMRDTTVLYPEGTATMAKCSYRSNKPKMSEAGLENVGQVVCRCLYWKTLPHILFPVHLVKWEWTNIYLNHSTDHLISASLVGEDDCFGDTQALVSSRCPNEVPPTSACVLPL